MEDQLKDSFQLYKAGGIAASLLLIVLFQLLFPNRLTLRRAVRNWSVNLPLVVIDTALIGLLCGACVCTWAVTVRQAGVGLFEAAALPYGLQVAATVVLLDLVAYLWHRANHRWRFLWRFHAVHHSDVHFEASTAFRFHPGELLISVGVRLLVVTATGLPILGLIVFEVLYGFCNLFVHSDIRINKTAERLLGFLLITPSLHRIHHSDQPQEHHTNFGTILSVWDRLWKTFLHADADTRVGLGLPQQQGRPTTLGEALKLPLGWKQRH